MNTLPELRLRDMTAADVDEVLAIEQQVHSHPWTRGNFDDSLASAYVCKVYAAEHEIIGYAVLMPALDEVQVLDISIARVHQRKGLGAKLLGAMLALARERRFLRVLLEVRRSNLAAYALYRKAGFSEIGVRRAYYPLQNGREDAIVMEYKMQ